MKHYISHIIRSVRKTPLRVRASLLKKHITLLEKNVASEKVLADEFTQESLLRRKRKGEKVHDGSPATSVIDSRMIFALDEAKRFEKKATGKKDKLVKIEEKLSSM